MNASDVKQMASRYFDATNVILVLVGNVKEIREGLHKEFPKARFEELAFDKVDLLAPDLRKPKPGDKPK